MDLELLILSFVDRSDGPVGSGVICDLLRQDGNEISEASVGSCCVTWTTGT
jgi:repressor of nif and glnA expression